jgi:ribosomal-protein-alanine N-acetyltransferase
MAINPFYRNLPRLETPRLILRQITLDDVPDIFAYASDAEATRYLRWGPHQTLAQTEAYVREVLQEYADDRDGPWGIVYKLTNRIVGHIHLMNISVQHRKAEIGFVMAKSCWNNGLATEALVHVLAYVFGTLALHRVEGFSLVDNGAAMRVMEKAGMQKEGVLRDYLFQKGDFRDFIVYAVLPHDFRQAG